MNTKTISGWSSFHVGGRKNACACASPKAVAKRGSRAGKVAPSSVSIAQWIEQTVTKDLKAFKDPLSKSNTLSEVRRKETLNLTQAKATGELIAYYSAAKAPGPAQRSADVGGWMGNTYASRVLVLSRMRDNFGGERIFIRFIAPWDSNSVWSGYAMGDGMYGRFKRTKLARLNS